MRQTPWRKGKMGVEIGHLYTTLSAHIHDPQQGGDALVISKESSLTIEGCLGFAALLSDYITIEFKDPKLIEKWKKNESAGIKKVQKAGGHKYA